MIKLKKLSIDGVDYTDYAVWTLQGQETLDESLDLNYIELKGTNIELPFKPFLDVDIQIDDGLYGYRIQRLVESDTVTEVTSNNTYNHDLLFIEETKWLERLFVEKTVRQPLIHDYSIIEQNNFVEVSKKYTTSSPGIGGVVNQESTNGYVPLIETVLVDKDCSIYNPIYLLYKIQQDLGFDMFIAPNGVYTDLVATLDIKDTEGKSIIDGTIAKIFGNEDIPTDKFNINVKKEGSYTVEIILTGNVLGASNILGKVTFDFSAIIQVEPRKDYTIRDVINHLLETCITLREDEEPLFTIAEPNNYSSASEDYKKQVQVILDTVSPEFTFSKMSLFEALKMIGDFAHFIPRLQNRKIYFDLLGQMEDGGADYLGAYYSNVSAQNSNDFCNALDSQVNNLTNMDDEAQGSVSTPNNFGYRTLRTEIGNAQIKDNNIIIPTEDNIEKIIKLEIGYLNDSDNTYVGDITPFVYEEDEYKALSSYTNTFPTSRMYAIKYKQGARNITGLEWKREHVVSPVFENMAIKNIIFKKLNKGNNWWNNFWKTYDIFKLQYRLTYIPSTNTKVIQHKQNPDDMSNKPLYIAYNQSASKVSSNAYGENLKGTVAKLGNVAKTKMYILPTFDLIPKCGTLFDKDYYISVVKYEVYPNFIKCEIGLSKNYNNKSAYVEINSQLEFFEYNRNITIDRYVVYEEFCEIADEDVSDLGSYNSMITEDGLKIFKNGFVYGSQGHPVSDVISQGFSDRSGELTKVALPIISLGVGNSLLFAFHYEDTISAGTRAFYSDDGKFQDLVKYTDIYGEVDKLKLKFGVNFNSPENYEDAVTRGDELPLTTYFGDMQTYFDTEDNKILLRKGVGEAIHFTYQIHFVTKHSNYIIGSGLTRKSIFTTTEPKMFKLYALTQEINKFETRIDLTNATEIGTLELDDTTDNKKLVKLKDRIAPDGTYKAWAIVQTYNNSNDLILGKNMEFVGGDTLIMPAFIFKRRLK